MSVEKRSSATERAKRLLYLRQEGIRLSREELSKRSGIPTNTIQNWEQARKNGLTEKGARRLIDAFRIEGLQCTPEWLLYGIGEKPLSPFISSNSVLPTNAKTTEEEIISKELKVFHELNPNAIDTHVNDDGMSPYFWPGDYVGGVQLFGKDIKLAIGLPCIVQTASGNVVVRILEEAAQVDCYNLICTNQNTIVKSVIENVKLISAAPVIWWRRRKFSTLNSAKTTTALNV